MSVSDNDVRQRVGEKATLRWRFYGELNLCPFPLDCGIHLSVGPVPLWGKGTFPFSWVLFFLSYIVSPWIFIQIDAEPISQEPSKSRALPPVEVSAHYLVSERSGGIFWWSKKLGRKNSKVRWVTFSISDSDLWATCAQLFCIIGSSHSYKIFFMYMYVNMLVHFMPVIFFCVFCVLWKQIAIMQ